MADNKPTDATTQAPGAGTAEHVAAGSKLEKDAAYANATPTEKKILDEAAFEFSGRVGKPFSATGPEGTFGTQPMPVIIGGRQVATTSFRDTSVKGTVPADLPPGDTTVQIGGKHVKTRI